MHDLNTNVSCICMQLEDLNSDLCIQNVDLFIKAVSRGPDPDP